ncbi:class I SAM-dependent methyltransferase [Pedobacter nyackensis]|uniref:Methyltransferase domain-containing protein n=1 Tax=Pedobacter nyackensis TaxID=475255 RepID=A0A1W2EVJ4_9SPHI|nr:class I SAM-dependent methyltransferase [Pedobacter nyackensis]SMD13188.1 Methyltransferase domain-containing protein [Pedobacter nyackensis]
MSKLTEQQLREIAGQLGKPEGADGIMTAERMAHTNNNMTKSAIEALDIAKGDVVLEIGPGNGTHVKDLMTKASGIRYYGVDISDTMVAEANRINEAEVNKGQVSFSLTAADKLNFDDEFFDKIFTVNTLYFWADPLAYAAEIKRVLKHGGLFCLAIGTKEFMEKLPFTKYRFKLYDASDAEQLFRSAGFIVTDVKQQKDLTTSHTGEIVDRDIIIMTARRDGK